MKREDKQEAIYAADVEGIGINHNIGLNRNLGGVTLSQEEINMLRDKFVGRDENYAKLSDSEKAEFLLKEFETSMIESMPDLDTVKKEFEKKTQTIEVDNSKDKIHNTHINIKASNTKLVMSSEGGKAITFNNKEALEEYRQALLKNNEKVQIEGEADILHNSRTFE